MSHDITRDSYALNRKKGYSKVRRLQGRIFTDADFNEQVDLADRRLRDFVGDLVGYHAGPADRLGFAVVTDPPAGQKGLRDFIIGAGTYYVDGIRALNADGKARFLGEPGTSADDLAFDKANALLVFLDVYSVPVTPLDDPDLIDPGFGRDSSDRDRWAWSVRAAEITPPPPPVPPPGAPLPPAPDPNDRFRTITRVELAKFVKDPGYGPRDPATAGGVLFAIGPPSALGDDRCIVLPDVATFTGPQDQLYRFEVHTLGTGGAGGKARFKWSRDNAAPAFAVSAWADGTPMPGPAAAPTWDVTLRSLDALGGLRPIAAQHWVEVLPRGWEAGGVRLPLLWVESIDPDSKVVTLSLGEPPPADAATLAERFATLVGVQAEAEASKLVLWDHLGGDPSGVAAVAAAWHVPASPATPAKDYPGVAVEHGLIALVDDTTKAYRAGDYWTFAARSADAASPATRPDLGDPFPPPDGPAHLYAPLAVLTVTNDAAETLNDPVDLRKKFAKIST